MQVRARVRGRARVSGQGQVRVRPNPSPDPKPNPSPDPDPNPNQAPPLDGVVVSSALANFSLLCLLPGPRDGQVPSFTLTLVHPNLTLTLQPQSQPSA